MLRLIPYFTCLFLWLPGFLNAQHVSYTDPLPFSRSSQIKIIGKSGSFYWTAEIQKRSRLNRTGSLPVQGFGLLDARLNAVHEYPAMQNAEMLKQWLVSGKEGLDQIMTTIASGKTQIIRRLYKADPYSEPVGPDTIDSFPFKANASELLLVRSEDQTKILLMAFENTPDGPLRLHTILFNADWSIIYHLTSVSDQFSAPCIQDDETGFPAESFDNLPVKLANNGEWLMAYPSRVSENFAVVHARSNGKEIYFHEMTLSSFYKMEDIAMSVDNNRQEISIGLLSAYAGTSLKNVHISKYSMQTGTFYFDSAFRFNTQLRSIGRQNISHESFLAVPGAGYIYLVEYGKPYDFKKPDLPLLNYWESSYLLTNYAEPEKQPVKNGYTANRGLTPIPIIRNPGDLNIFYFPSVSKDSSWSGVLDMEQHPELNNSDLSYLFVPAGNKLLLIYNQPDPNTDQIATATALNKQGQESSAPIVFWRMDRTLNFQRARRITADEVAVPYRDGQQTGFAMIKR